MGLNGCFSLLRFVRALDKVAGSLPLSDGQPSRLLVAPSVAVQTNRVNPVSFNGLSLAVQTPTADPNKLTADSMVNEELPPKEVQTSITLPEALFQNKTPSNDAVKVGFVIYQNDIFFQPAVSDEEESIPSSVISKVGSSSVQDLTFQNLTQPVELVFQPAINVDESSGNAVCVFWDFDALGKRLDRGNVKAVFSLIITPYLSSTSPIPCYMDIL